MENQHTIMNELREISPLIAEIKKENVYSVPPDYFNNLAENILKKINSASLSAFHFSSITPYKVKEGYFENFSLSVLQKIHNQHQTVHEVSDELNDIAPLLNTISKTSMFSVPEGYFENLQVLPNQPAKPQAKISSLAGKFMRYAVAAVIAALMAFGIYLITGKDLKKNGAQAVNIKSAIKDLKDDEIIEFLRKHSSLRSATTVSSEINTSAPKINESLKQMTDEEIQQYLQENSEYAEIELDI